MRLPNGDVLPLRCTVACGPIGSAEVAELRHSAHHTADHNSDRLSVDPCAESAPAAPLTPAAAAGALINTPVHGEWF